MFGQNKGRLFRPPKVFKCCNTATHYYTKIGNTENTRKLRNFEIVGYMLTKTNSE